MLVVAVLLLIACFALWLKMRKPLEKRIRFGQAYQARGLGLVATGIYRRHAAAKALKDQLRPLLRSSR